MRISFHHQFIIIIIIEFFFFIFALERTNNLLLPAFYAYGGGMLVPFFYFFSLCFYFCCVFLVILDFSLSLSSVFFFDRVVTCAISVRHHRPSIFACDHINFLNNKYDEFASTNYIIPIFYQMIAKIEKHSTKSSVRCFFFSSTHCVLSSQVMLYSLCNRLRCISL